MTSQHKERFVSLLFLIVGIAYLSMALAGISTNIGVGAVFLVTGLGMMARNRESKIDQNGVNQ